VGKNKVKLNIHGIDYMISSDDEEFYIKMIADEVEDRISEILNYNKIPVIMATTLAALEYCDISKKTGNNEKNLRRQLKDYLEESSQMREEFKKAKEEIENLKIRLAKCESVSFKKNSKIDIKEKNNSENYIHELESLKEK